MVIDPIERLQKYAALVGLVLFLTSVVGTGLYVKHLTDKVAELESTNLLLQADLSAAKTYRREQEALTKNKQETDTRVDEVLEANRVWADEPLPDDVAGLLRQHPDS